jgi:hypothetical protein
MTRLAAVLATLILLVSPVGAGEQSPTPLSPEEALDEFGAVVEDGGLTLAVIHLNDRSVEALFSAPSKYSLRVQAKQSTMFFVQGTNDGSRMVRPGLEWQIRQDANLISSRVVSISNFEENSEVSRGDQYSGLVVADGLVDPRSAFTVENGSYHFDFDFSASQADMIDPR